MPLALALETQPGDDLLACPAMLSELRAEGFEVCSLLLDRNGAKQRRVSSGVHDKLGFALMEPSDPVSLRPPDTEGLERVIGEALTAFSPAVLLSPYIHEQDVAYRAVSQAARAAVESYGQQTGEAPMLWMYARGTLPESNVFHPFSSFDELSKASKQGAASYLRRAGVCGSLHGAKLCEEVLELQLFSDGRWRAGVSRVFSTDIPEASAEGPDMRAWLDTPSLPV